MRTVLRISRPCAQENKSLQSLAKHDDNGNDHDNDTDYDNNDDENAHDNDHADDNDDN